jgi:threonine/homoserine/homoserine lactone efflux protein
VKRERAVCVRVEFGNKKMLLMTLLLQGVLLGLSLSLLTGPMMFIFIQTGIEHGFRAGALTGLGVWMSDLFYILFAYFGLANVLQLTEGEGFKLWMGLIGGAILVVFGLATLLNRPPRFKKKARIRFPAGAASRFKLWLKGFLINTFNPFTALFWIGVMGALSVKDDFSGFHAGIFFAGALSVIVLADMGKVLLAKRIQDWMRYSYLLTMRRIAGTALVVLGIVLMVRVMV